MKVLRYTALALLAVLLLGCSKTDLGPITQEQALRIACSGKFASSAISALRQTPPFFGTPRFVAFGKVCYYGFSSPEAWEVTESYVLYPCYIWAVATPQGMFAERVVTCPVYINAYTGQLLGIGYAYCIN